MKLSRASAAIISNEGNPGRTGILNGNLSGTENIPVIFTSYAVGTQLLDDRFQGVSEPFRVTGGDGG